MFSSGPNYSKLKTNLRLAVSRLKLLEKKNTELAQKARREISEYIANGKLERAKIKVEHIIREDFQVEAMELVEMYCDLLLARFGLLQSMKNLDEGLAEAITSLIWVAPRMQADVAELKPIAETLSMKFDKLFVQNCREGNEKRISDKLKQKLNVQAPPKILTEQYLIEIARSHNVTYEPDPQIINTDGKSSSGVLIDFGDGKMNNLDDEKPHPTGVPSAPGFIDFPSMPLPPYSPPVLGPVGPSQGLPNIYPGSPYSVPPRADDVNTFGSKSSMLPSTDITKSNVHPVVPSDFLNLPSVPDEIPPVKPPDSNEDVVDFDDLTKRFEELKKRK